MSKIYFLQVGTDGPIKIGFAGVDAKQRIRSLQTISPHVLRLIGVFEGSRSDEARTHRLFRQSHYRGEWFHPTAELHSFIAQKSPNFEPVVVERPTPKKWCGGDDVKARQSSLSGLGCKPVQKLKDWLKHEGLTVTEFARHIRRSQPTVTRYIKGERIPEMQTMLLIMKMTKNKVQPNDFYEAT